MAFVGGYNVLLLGVVVADKAAEILIGAGEGEGEVGIREWGLEKGRG